MHSQEFASCHCFAGQATGIPRDRRGQTGERYSRRIKGTWRRAIRGFLTVALVRISLCGYITSRPNTVGVSSDGPFDGEHAFADLKRLVAFGPRPSSSAEMDRSGQFIAQELRAAGATITEDNFTASTPIGPIPIVKLSRQNPRQVLPSSFWPVIATRNEWRHGLSALTTQTPPSCSNWPGCFCRGAISSHTGGFSSTAKRQYSASPPQPVYMGAGSWPQNLQARPLKAESKPRLLWTSIADPHLDIHSEAQSTHWLKLLTVC